MTLKIQKTWMYINISFAVIASLTYYFQDTFSDNTFQITSSSINLSYVSYIFFSVLVSVNFLIGPWIISLAFVHAIFYWTRVRFRNNRLDLLAPPLMFIFVLLLTDSVASFLVGPGLHFLLKSLINNSNLRFLLIALLLLSIIYLWAPINYSIVKNRLFNFLIEKSNNWKNSKFQNQTVPTAVQVEKIESMDADQAHPLLGEVELLNKPIINEEVSHEDTDRKPQRKSVELTKKVFKKETLDYFSLIENKMKGTSFQHNTPEKQYFDVIIGRIEEKLAEFKIDGTIINIMKGPVVDTFELELGSGVKVSKITSITEDISLALFGAPIRIVYPMKGKSTVGIEVPRNPREIIFLGEILNSEAWKKNNYSLPLAMGKDAFGEPFVVDLANMPHMLVAGATGAGKSVFINSLLMSLLVKKSPDQMRLILIDPKQLELALYSKLPHLILPVLTDAKSASAALLYAVQEMERRYSILKEFAVRNIEGFNRKIKDATDEQIEAIRKFYKYDSPNFDLPYLVIIVDEFADLILTKSGKDIENNICRLAAKARASGIHLVLATQRPSVDVITGLIKSNFPTRVSFRVTTSVDSRTILNSIGAERLLGKGDMLYKHGVEMIRVHSSFVEEDEIEAFTEKLVAYENHFDSTAIDFLESNQNTPGGTGGNYATSQDSATSDLNDDEFYEQAVRVVAECRSASASMLQRRLKVGYNRAANLIEIMEQRGVVGPAQGSKPRKVLISSN